jgi:uncharacterized Zn finger protein (UPF0148 family)
MDEPLCPRCTHDLTVSKNGDEYCQICGYEHIAIRVTGLED